MLAIRINDALKKKIISFNQIFLHVCFLRWLKYIIPVEIVHLNKKQYLHKSDRPLMVIANHNSAWDPFLIFSTMDEEFFLGHCPWRLPVYHSFFEKFYFRWLLKFAGTYSIKPLGSLEKSLQKTFEILQDGSNTIFFPEGERVRGGEKSGPKRGIGHIINEMSVLIMPVYIHYSNYEASGFGSIRQRTKIIFGEVTDSEYFLENWSDNHHNAVMDCVWSLRDRDANINSDGNRKHKSQTIKK